MFKPQHGVITAGAVTAALGVALLVGSAALATGATGTNTTVEAATVPLEAGYPVENYIHPNAETIAASTGVVLKEGDGHLMYTDCTNDREQIQVSSTVTDRPKMCFALTGTTGRLTMEIHGSYGVRAGKTHDLTVTTTDNGHTETRTITKGERDDIRNAIGNAVILVELRIK